MKKLLRIINYILYIAMGLAALYFAIDVIIDVAVVMNAISNNKESIAIDTTLYFTFASTIILVVQIVDIIYKLKLLSHYIANMTAIIISGLILAFSFGGLHLYVYNKIEKNGYQLCEIKYIAHASLRLYKKGSCLNKK